MENQSAAGSTMFANHCLDELIPHLCRGFNGTTFNEFAAAYERMLEITFHDVATPNEDRALAASWAKILESLVVLTLVGHEHLLQPFMEARNSSKQLAEKYGYGSIGWLAIHDPDNFMSRVWPGDESPQNPKRESVNEHRRFLLSVVFGRTADASNNEA